MKEAWSIKSRARECAGTEEAFTDGQVVYASIFPDPDSSGYLRRDYSEKAWKERDQSETPFSHWVTNYKAPIAEEKAEDVVEEDPETLLRRLVEEDEEYTENVRYILAVMLERQKLLRETDTNQLPSGILRFYEHRKTGDAFIIKDPQIPLSDVEKVQEEVRNLLEPEPEIEEESAPAETAEPATEEPTDTLEQPTDSEEE